MDHGGHPAGHPPNLISVELGPVRLPRRQPSELGPVADQEDQQRGRTGEPVAVPNAVGDPGEYLSRPGFWHGAIGVAACWLGGARRVAKPLYRCAASESADAHSLAHLGAVDAALAAADAMLTTAAAQVDADPFDRSDSAELLARRRKI